MQRDWAKVRGYLDDTRYIMEMSANRKDIDSAATTAGRMERIPGIIEQETLEHLLDVELARARRYEHPFALLRVALGDELLPDRLRAAAGALRLHTRWADSVGLAHDGALLVILRDTPAEGARAAVAKIRTSLDEELGDLARELLLTSATWRKGDDRDRLLARLR